MTTELAAATLENIRTVRFGGSHYPKLTPEP